MTAMIGAALVCESLHWIDGGGNQEFGIDGIDFFGYLSFPRRDLCVR